MLNTLERLWSDVRKGENIDLYLTIIVGIMLAITNIVGFTPDKWISPITLAVLSLFAISILGNRYRLDLLVKQKTKEDIFLREYPEIRVDEMIRADELWLIGINLHRTLYANPWLGNKLRNKNKVNVLLVNPTSGAIKYVVRRYANNQNQEELEEFQRSTISSSLNTLSKLKEKYPDFIDIRIVDYPLSFGAFATDIDSAKGKIYLEQYRYQMPGDDDIPKMMIEPADGTWYELYKKQIIVLWENATPFQKP